jgi:hypothetical protein
MRKSCTYGSVRGASSNGGPYRDRRSFISLVGGAAVAWSLDASAQQGERMRRIGVLLPAGPDDGEVQSWVGAFLQGLAQSGWITGRNIRIETRWTKFDAEETHRYAAELVALAPDAILATGNSTVGPLLRLTRTVPRRQASDKQIYQVQGRDRSSLRREGLAAARSAPHCAQSDEPC